jgi:hypothetical protein
MSIKNILGVLLALGMLVVGMAGAAVQYNTDVFGKGAPYISTIDPYGDKVTVTNPGQPVVGNLKFINVFGQTLKNEGNITLATGDTTFDIVLADRGNIGLHTNYYLTPTKEQVATGMLGIKNNDDLALYNIVAWLPRHEGQVYKLGKNGIWGWV